MEKLKKLNGSMIAAIVLSVLLIMSLTAGATLAWFSSRDTGTRTLTMGEAIVVTVSDEDPDKTYRQGAGTLAMALPVDEASNGLIPGMSVQPNIKIQLQKSNTNALVRARFITTVEYPNNYEDAAYTDRVKYPNAATYVEGAAGTVLDNEQFPDSHIFASTIHYDYYNADGELIKYWTAAEIEALAEEDRPKAAVMVDGKCKSDGKYALDKNGARIENGTLAAGQHSVEIFLARVKVRDSIFNAIGGTTTIAGVESTPISTTNAAEMEIRQRGADLTEVINKVLSGEQVKQTGVKYTRRVADGWAYRQADKAWYYMGSNTNGYVLANQTGVSEDVDDTKPIANDITAYTEDTTVQGTSVFKPTYNVVAGDGNARNYLGAQDAATGVVNAKDNEIAVLSADSMASVDLSQGNVSIDFLTKRFSLPSYITNDYAKARITFSFTVEAVQDYLINPTQEGLKNPARVPNNLTNAIIVFNSAYQAGEISNENDLSATGTYYNVQPGAKLDAADIPNKGYVLNAEGIADYTQKNGTYGINGASSLGVQPDGTAKVTLGA